MSEAVDADCPECGQTRVFELTASTALGMGLKTKWACVECDTRLVRIFDGGEYAGNLGGARVTVEFPTE